MKIPTHILTGVALFAAALSTSYGQSATTTPVGYRTENVKAGYNLLGVDLAEKVEAAGVIDAVAGNVITDNDVDFTSLGTKDLLFKLTDGANAGSLWQADMTSAHTLTLVATPPTTLPAVGGKYELRLTSTISSLFGATNSAGLHSGTDETIADAVYIPTGGGFLPVFYANAADAGSLGLSAGWYDSSFNPAGDTPIPYSLPVYIRNNRLPANTAAFDIVFVGHVVTGPTKVTLTAGTVAAPTRYTYVSRILPVSMTTTQSNLQTSLTSGTDELSADAIYNPIAPGQFDVFFYANAADAGTLGLPAGWYNSSFEDASTKVLSSGFIIRRNTDPGNNHSATLPIPAGLDI